MHSIRLLSMAVFPTVSSISPSMHYADQKRSYWQVSVKGSKETRRAIILILAVITRLKGVRGLFGQERGVDSNFDRGQAGK